MSYKVAYVKFDSTTVLSTFCFASREDAKTYQMYIFGIADEDKIVEDDCEPNAEYVNGALMFNWRFKP